MLDEGVTGPEFQGPRYVTNPQLHGTTEGTGRAGEPLEKRRLALVFRQARVMRMGGYALMQRVALHADWGAPPAPTSLFGKSQTLKNGCLRQATIAGIIVSEHLRELTSRRC